MCIRDRYTDLPRYGSIEEVRRFLADAASGGIAGVETRTVGEIAGTRP